MRADIPSCHQAMAHASIVFSASTEDTQIDVFRETTDDGYDEDDDLASTCSSSDDNSVDTNMSMASAIKKLVKKVPTKAIKKGSIKKAISKLALAPSSSYSHGKTIDDTRDDVAANSTARCSGDSGPANSSEEQIPRLYTLPYDNDDDLASMYSSSDDSSIDTGLTTDSKGFPKRRMPGKKAIKKAISKRLSTSSHKPATTLDDKRDDRFYPSDGYFDDYSRLEQTPRTSNNGDGDAISAFIITLSSSKKSKSSLSQGQKKTLSSLIIPRLKKSKDIDDASKIYGHDGTMSVLSFGSATPTVKVTHVAESSKTLLRAKLECRKADIAVKRAKRECCKADINVRQIEHKIARARCSAIDEEEFNTKYNNEWHTSGRGESSCTSIMLDQVKKLFGKLSRCMYCQDDARTW